MYSFKNLDEIKKYQKVNYLNKFVILVITLIVLYFSFNLVDRGIEISKNYSPIIYITFHPLRQYLLALASGAGI